MRCSSRFSLNLLLECYIPSSMAINDAMQMTFSAAILSIGVYSEIHERVFVRWNESRTQIIHTMLTFTLRTNFGNSKNYTLVKRMYHLYERPLIHSNWYQCFQYRVLTSQPTVLSSSSQHDSPPHHDSPTPYHPSSTAGCPQSTASSTCQSLSSLSGELLVGGRELLDKEKSKMSDLEPASMNLRKHHPICTAVEVSLPRGSIWRPLTKTR
jgi:hypothetical protein